MNAFNVLRAIANRLNTTPIEDLPQQVGYLATSIASCKDVLQNNTPGNNENALLFHKLKTRVSALLQDRTPEGRLSGIVIVKALVEAGGLPFLSESGSWVRNLISCLNKSDPWEVKRLCVITISRIYLLTVEHQAQIREVTTPTLPAFITASLGVVKPATTTVNGKAVRALSPLLEVVLNIWHALIEPFASTFRPHVNSLRSICLSLLSDSRCANNVRLAATNVLARLHFCAPKNTITTEWSQTCTQVIEAVHNTADLVFRAVIEDWTPAVSRTSKVTRKQKSANIPATSNADVLGLDAWSGVSEGTSRLVVEINLMTALATSQHSQATNIPIGQILDLTARLSAMTLPTSKFALRANTEVTREEREELWLNLLRVHIAVLNLFEVLASTYGKILFPVSNTITTQLWDIFEAEHFNESVRAAVYTLLTALLPHQLLHLTKSDSPNISALINHCCEDLKAKSGHSSNSTTNQSTATNGNKATLLTLSTQLNKPITSAHASPSPELHTAAHNLLPILLIHAPLHILPNSPSLRANLDSTAILIQHHEAILASTLHPPRARTNHKTRRAPAPPSLLPFLAHIEPESPLTNLAKEALLHPRMPVIRSIPTIEEATDDEDEDDVEHEHEHEHDTHHNEPTTTTTYPDDPPNLPTPSFQDSYTGTQTQLNNNDQIPLRLPPNPTTQAPTTASPIQALHSFTTSQKRDFTTLLEQSADAQLAENDMRISPPQFDVSGNTAGDDDGSVVGKRQRVDGAVSRGERLRDIERLLR